MTTIAYRDGIMAADSRAYSGDKNPFGSKTKIHRLPDGSLFGASSSKVGVVDKLRRLTVEHGVSATFPTVVEGQALLVKPNGDVFLFNEQDGFSGPIRTTFCAIGSGEQYAMGAFHMGADAARAVSIACECDVWTGGEITVLALQQEDV